MKQLKPNQWSNLLWWVHFYAYLTLGVVVYGIMAAHIPAIIGHPWTSCDIGGLGCILTFHLFDVPMAFYNAFLAWYALVKFSSRTAPSFLVLLVIGVGLNLVFFSFEVQLIFDSFDRAAPLWEIIALYSIAISLISGAFLGVYIALKIVLYLQYRTKPCQKGLTMAADGYYHPATEEEIIALVKKANACGVQVRCRGAAHSVAQSIYTDAGEGEPEVPNKVSEDTPPSGPNINIMLDRFTGINWLDVDKGIVEAEAGIHLGADPGKSLFKDSFLWKIWEKGWALADLGGITHQTISGFMMTGSAGGTLTYDLATNIEAFRVVDGLGNVEWIDKSNPNFYAMGSSLGLLGIVTKVRFKLTPRFLIKGQQKTTPTALKDCEIDLFGAGQDGKPSMESFLKKTPYTRLMWWPQKGSERIVIWQAEREDYDPHSGFKPTPYHEFSPSSFLTDLQELGAAILFTILGNKNFFVIWWKLLGDFNRFRALLKGNWQKKISTFLAWISSFLVTLLIFVIAFIPICIFAIFKFIPRLFLSKIINLIQPLTSDKNPVQEFEDYYYRSLPMDNVADDILLGTEFTEIWLPIQYSQQVMNLLNDHYIKYKYKATGAFSNELYGGHPSSFWMHQGYTNGEDLFKDGTIRVDVFWYTANAGAPNTKGGYYDQFWKLFREANIPFRLHWGKFVPDYDFEDWAKYYEQQLPKFKDFLALREERDPNNIFLTDYWKLRLYGKLKA